MTENTEYVYSNEVSYGCYFQTLYIEKEHVWCFPKWGSYTTIEKLIIH